MLKKLFYRVFRLICSCSVTSFIVKKISCVKELIFEAVFYVLDNNDDTWDDRIK